MALQSSHQTLPSPVILTHPLLSVFSFMYASINSLCSYISLDVINSCQFMSTNFSHFIQLGVQKIFFGILKSSILTTRPSHSNLLVLISDTISVVVGYTLEFQIGSSSPHSVFAYGTINFSQYALFPSHQQRNSSFCQ
jgi:hypothetical protein